eukprot:5749489-Pyramimonas_sp.AAC.1
MSGAESLGAGHGVQCALRGQSEDMSDLLSIGDSSHSIEENEDYARFRTSPGPSHHPDPLPDQA